MEESISSSSSKLRICLPGLFLFTNTQIRQSIRVDTFERNGAEASDKKY